MRLPVPDEVAIYLKMALTKNPKKHKTNETDDKEEDHDKEDENQNKSLMFFITFNICMTS